MGITKLIRRSVGIMSLSLLIILLANLTLLTVFALRSTAGGHPWTMAAETASALQRTDSGYALDAGQAQALESEGAWAVLVDTGTLSVSWHTENAPAAALEQYTAAGIAMLTRGYIDDCPTFTASMENGDLVVVGFPDGSYWKHMYPSWDYDLIANAPLLFFILMAFNLLLVMGIYVAANSRLYKSVRPIEEGVEALPTLMGTPVRERGLLAPLAQSINRTAEILRSQRAELRRKDMARSEWISGVSHDIRTPLVMVMGYASQLEANTALPEEARRKAGIILRQSVRIRDLVADLNLASRLEYSMQPLNVREVSLVSVARAAAAEFVDADAAGLWPLDWDTPEGAGACTVQGDEALLRRAVTNALTNCRKHNPEGCRVSLTVCERGGTCAVTVRDDGAGADPQAPTHGLGLLLIRRIAAAHHGEAVITTAPGAGFTIEISLPKG